MVDPGEVVEGGVDLEIGDEDQDGEHGGSEVLGGGDLAARAEGGEARVDGEREEENDCRVVDGERQPPGDRALVEKLPALPGLVELWVAERLGGSDVLV